MSDRPLEAFFPTGHASQTLALMICSDWIWAGLYDGKVTPSLDGCAVAPRLRARATARHLCIGRDSFALAPRVLLRATRWLRMHGVRVQEQRA
ncbi:hypothetical protein [Xanthomonas euvesicatoria]|uniref:Uncharacterized protein n=1 Tax=Xanthomonas euvesicatoria TaxID=456327 RepID=A0AAW3U1U6_XANEU|nr:hypothetical protein [Xanthomonas euvesicatoria]MBB4722725.1 hypothetical protein [Xanthomonas euvesicatoria]MBB4869318.1 hypothetical protein [Xanthomonas euvesicatoria]